MTQFKILSVYKDDVKRICGRTHAPQVAVAEVFFPAIGLTLRDVRLVRGGKGGYTLHMPRAYRGGLPSIQLSAATAEAIKLEIVTLYQTAPDYEEAA